MKGSENDFPYVELAEGSAPAAGAAAITRIYTKSDGLVYSKDDAGVETLMSSGGSGAVATDAIWDAAGDLAVGSGANTAAKLGIGNAGAHLSRINGAVAWNSSTSFPTAAAGDRFWRTDRGLEYYYDGTRWLSTTLYHQPFTLDAIAPLPATANGNLGHFLAWHSTYDLWLDTFYTTVFVLTTNDGTKFWTVALTKQNAANSNTAVVSHTTAAHTASNWTTTATAIGALMDSTTYKIFTVTGTKTSTPGNLYYSAAISYRLVG